MSRTDASDSDYVHIQRLDNRPLYRAVYHHQSGCETTNWGTHRQTLYDAERLAQMNDCPIRE